MKQIKTLPELPPRPDDAHKGTFGTVIVVGGCPTMLGAPALCARAAFRGGAGLVKIATHGEVLPYVLTIEPSATGIAIAGDNIDADLRAIDAADPEGRAVLAVGPGMGSDPIRRALAGRLFDGPRQVVVDADGLNAIAASLNTTGSEKTPDAALALLFGLQTRSQSTRLLTPHPGEFLRLAQPLEIEGDPTDPAQRVGCAGALAKALDAVVLLKGKDTVITDGQRYRINTTGNPVLATAGSGDVLTGLIASLIAQGMALFEAAQLGAHLHGQAADQWKKQHGPRGLRAIELADCLYTNQEK